MPDVDERLREWAYFFRDRRRFDSCRSIEHRFRRVFGEGDPDGWGDLEKPAPDNRPKPQLLRAIETHEALMTLPKTQKWAITYAFCYHVTGLPVHFLMHLKNNPLGRPGKQNTYVIAHFCVFGNVINAS